MLGSEEEKERKTRKRNLKYELLANCSNAIAQSIFLVRCYVRFLRYKHDLGGGYVSKNASYRRIFLHRRTWLLI